MVRVIKNIVNDLLDQAWTLLGMFIAWVVLDGSAKTVVGYGIIITTAIWILTSPIRNKDTGEE
jgi:ABC-type multidrug transport system permease subunit